MPRGVTLAVAVAALATAAIGSAEPASTCERATTRCAADCSSGHPVLIVWSMAGPPS